MLPIRKLLWTACGYTLALLAAHYLLPFAWLPWAAAGAAALGLSALLLRHPRRLAAVLCLLAAGAGCLWYWGYARLTLLPAEAFVGEKRTVRVCVTGYANDYGDYARIRVRSVDGAVPHVQLLVYDYDGDLGDLCPGDLAELPLKLLSARQMRGADSDYYISSGIQLRGYLTDRYAVTGRTAWAWRYLPLTLGELVKTRALACFPADTAPLMKALLTGDRTEYYLDDALYSAMRTAGFVHIIAVSGMHVAFLVSMLRLLTRRRRLTALLGVPMILIFMAMVGFTPSVVRAGVMQILVLLAPLLGREEDPPTSLGAALLLLLAVNPAAVGSLSLQLSFAAMAGLITVTPRIFDFFAYDERGRYRLRRAPWGRLTQWVCSAFAASVGASVFTTPIVAVSFGYVPLYSLLTNLLCLWPMSTAFLCGYGVCLLGALWQPAGMAAGALVGWLPRYTIAVVTRIARFPYAAVYTRRNLGGWWLIFVYVLFGVTYALRGKGRYRPVLPVCAALCSLALTTFFVQKNLPGLLEVSAVDVGQGQSIVAMTENATAMIDCGSTGAQENAGDVAADYLGSCGRRRVDLLILTHFHGDHVNGVKRLMSRVEVARLVIAGEYEENEYAADILAACRRYGTEVYSVSENTTFQLDGLSLTVYAPLSDADVNEACLLIYGDFGDFEFLVTGDAGRDVERTLLGRYPLGDMELLVAGHHGSRYSTCAELLDGITPEYAFISVGAGNDYGHPAPEVLERLAERDIAVYRTDLDGTVSITVGREHGEDGEDSEDEISLW